VSRHKGRNSLKAFESEAPRIIFERKRHQVRRGWRKLRFEELHNLYASTNIITWSNQGEKDGRGK
jgi:hypothetical protein